MSDAASALPGLPAALREAPAILEPGLQWVALAEPDEDPLPLLAVGSDALGRPVLLLAGEDLGHRALAALIDALAEIRRDGPPQASAFRYPHQARLVWLSRSKGKARLRRRLDMLQGLCPLVWWQWSPAAEPRLYARPLHELQAMAWAEGLDAATRSSLHRLLRGAGRLQPPLEMVDLGQGLLLRHACEPLLVLHRHGQEIDALGVGLTGEARPLAAPLVVDHLLDGLLEATMSAAEKRRTVPA